MFNAFNVLDEFLLEEEMVNALVSVSVIEEYEGTELSFNIDKVLKGNGDIEGGIFLVERSVLEDEDTVYQAELMVYRYDHTSFPYIECVSISPIS